MRGWLLFLAVALSLLASASAEAQEDSVAAAQQHWDSFYVVVGSSAGALTGLMFVVIALSADRREAPASGLRAFATPTIFHFCAVLLLGALLLMPNPGELLLGVLVVANGAVGIAFLTITARRMSEPLGYKLVLSDWVWHVLLTWVAYLGVALGGITIGLGAAAGFYAIGAGALLLLFIGIHNAWDAAVWITVGARAQAAKEKAAQQAAAGSAPRP